MQHKENNLFCTKGNATSMECINEDCIEETDNAGGLCKACMGLAQKRAELTRQAAERHRQGAQKQHERRFKQ